MPDRLARSRKKPAAPQPSLFRKPAPTAPAAQSAPMPLIGHNFSHVHPQAKTDTSTATDVQQATEPGAGVDQVLRSTGQPLDGATRSFMEDRFGHDFSQVQVHTGTQADTSAQTLNARAYTVGQNIVFGAGEYAPATDTGKHLLAHELTHVVQQGSAGTIAPQTQLQISQPGDPAEQEAEAVADRIMAGDSADVSQASGWALQGDWRDTLADWAGDVTNSRPNEAELDAQEDAQAELEAFMSQTYSETNHHPTTGRGLFDVDYNPVQGELKITVKLCFQFNSGDPTNAEWIAAVGGPAAAAAYTPDQFAWQPGETDAWKTNAISQMEGAWSDQYTFHSTKPYWDTLPNVNVTVDIVEASARDAHFVTTVNKWPKDGGPNNAVTPPGSANQSTAHFEESADNGITTPDVNHYVRDTSTRAAYGIVDTNNPGQIFFPLGGSEVSAADKTKLSTFGQTLGRPEIPPFAVTLTGHASSEGTDEDNLRLSEDRARSVSNEIVSAGAKKQPTSLAEGERGADATAAWRRVDIVVGNFESDQTSVVHEFGHMLGLGDEYPAADSETDRTVGQPVAHSALAESLIPGQQPIVAHHDESIMSNGEVVRPYHYVTFLEALGKLTDTVGKWDIGPGHPRHQGMGDFPAPAGNTGMG